MRRIAAATLLLFLSSLAMASSAELSGRVKLFSSLFLQENTGGKFFSHDAGEFAYKRVEVRLQLSGELSDRVSYGFRLDAYSRPDALFGGNVFPESGILGSPSLAEPFELSLYEAYIKISDFLIENLDLTIGKQRVQWGTADKVNVVDNLNPVDFANFFTFDPDYFAERRPQAAFNFEYYFSETTKLQLVWLLSRQYAPLPAGFSVFAAASSPLPAEIYVSSEKPLLKNTNLGLRFSTVILNTDVALSYYHGNFSLPVLEGLDFSRIVTLDVHYFYPELDVVGLELAGELASVGFWAEVAYFMPDQAQGFVMAPMKTYPFVSVRQDVDLLESGYFKYVVGGDYTFGIGSGLYVNVQYLHGFFDERDYTEQAEKLFGFSKGQFFGELEDYIIARAEYKFLNGDLKLSFGGIVEFGDDATCVVYTPSLEYRAADRVIFQAGAFLASGDEKGTKFGQFKEDKLIYLLVRVDF